MTARWFARAVWQAATMQIRSLGGVSWDDIASTFTEAFSDYAVSMPMTGDSLAAMQRRRGYVAELSFAAYDGPRMIGFVLTCLEGDRAYNSGTGVVPSHRRTGVARELLEAVIASTRASTYVLEVLEENARAIAFYASTRFVETRRMQCWTFGHKGPPLPEIASPDLAEIAAHAETPLSWQNSLASLRRAREPHVVLGDERGAAVVFPGSGDLPLLTVARQHPRRGLGRRLLGAAAALSARPLRVLNIDDRAVEIAAFLDTVGATRFVRQLEMVRELR
jgi:ribosomal protein S18 acetylase RimI-like enzyme